MMIRQGIKEGGWRVGRSEGNEGEGARKNGRGGNKRVDVEKR